MDVFTFVLHITIGIIVGLFLFILYWKKVYELSRIITLSGVVLYGVILCSLFIPIGVDQFEYTYDSWIGLFLWIILMPIAILFNLVSVCLVKKGRLFWICANIIPPFIFLFMGIPLHYPVLIALSILYLILNILVLYWKKEKLKQNKD